MERMKYLFVETSHERFPISLQIEYALELLKAGEVVQWHRLKIQNSFTTKFPLTDYSIVNLGLGNLSKLLRTLEIDYPNFQLKYIDIGEIKPLSVEEVDYGKAWQEVTTILRDSMPCKKHNQDLAKELARLHRHLRSIYAETISQNAIDKIVIFNGRFLLDSSLWIAAQDLGIPIVFLERFNLDWNNRYFLFDKAVHSAEYRAEIMRDYYAESALSKSEKEVIGSRWFEERIFKKGSSYTSGQDISFEDNGEDCKVISFFHSSEDELFSIGLEPVGWKSQFDAILDLIDIINELTGYILVIRIHPNLRYKSSREMRRWIKFSKRHQSSRIKFLLPESRVSSYDLVRKSSMVLTFGSTIGVEASFLGKPSGLMSSALHSHLNVVTKIDSKRQLSQFINGNYNTKVDLKDLLAYGLFLRNGGILFTNLEISEEELDRQDPKVKYRDISILDSIMLSLVKRLDGTLNRIKSRWKDGKCPLDHEPFIHFQVSG